MASRTDPAPSNAPRLAWPVALLYAFLRAAGFLPLSAVHALGAALGHAMWLFGGRARRIAERNLSLVITQDGAKRRHVARASVIETGKAIAEIAAIWGRPPERALKLIREVRGADVYAAALARGNGLIVAAPHLGCWELLNYWVATQGPLSIVYRPPRQAALEPLLIRVRGHLPVEQVRAAGAGVRALYRRLAAGETVGILPDQRPKQGEGVMAPFFGVPSLTMVLLSRLARSTGATVLFTFAERLPRGAGYRIHVLEAPPGIDDADLDVACAALNRGVEQCVQLAFAQYQWTYKRFPDDVRAAGP
ncbi:MAG: lipid A biosynthesis acyltransferase [Rhodanobacteraceae bacterium]